MTEQEIIYTMALTRVPRLNPTNQRILLQELGSATAVFENRKDLKQVLPDASEKLVEAVAHMDEQLIRAEEEVRFVMEKKVDCLCFHDAAYPQRLKECPDAPSLLVFKGNVSLNQSRIINIVGTRHCTEYGKDICSRFIRELSELCPEVLVVSGLAYGVDIQAHRRALENGLPTVGVLAHGLDQIYPRMHRDTAIQMMTQGGLLTEFMSGTNADKVNFVRRNRIVAGISDATIVVESAEKGGALITADIASSYHRDVFAFPGRIGDPYSQGCNRLIRDSKAALLESAQGFMEAMGWPCKKKEENNGKSCFELFPDLCEEEQRIVDCLRQHDKLQINMLTVATNLPVHKLSAFLFNLEMKGIIKQLSGGMYRLL